jgi:hypothetical protein
MIFDYWLAGIVTAGLIPQRRFQCPTMPPIPAPPISARPTRC